MTILAKYTLTEAHFIIVELEREVKRLNHDLKEQKAISGNWERLYEREKALVKELKDDLRDFTNDEIQTDRALRKAIHDRDRKHRLLQDAWHYVHSGLMAAAHQTYHQSQQDLLDRYREEIGRDEG